MINFELFVRLLAEYRDNDWIIDFFLVDRSFECWLRRKDYGIAEFVCGVSCLEYSYDDFKSMMFNPDYLNPVKQNYISKFCD